MAKFDPLPETPEWTNWTFFCTIDYAFDLNDLAKFGFGIIFGDWGTTSCSMYDGMYDGHVVYLTQLDYCNGLLGGALKCLLSPLSRVLRAAARLILLRPRTSSVENEIRTVLHWLDVPARVTFKLCLLAHRCLHGSAPPYLIRYFTPVSSIAGRSHLRLAVTGTVFVPGSRTSTIGPRAFAISSPSAWNSLLVDLRDPGLSLLTFRRRLKTYLFNPPGYLSP